MANRSVSLCGSPIPIGDRASVEEERHHAADAGRADAGTPASWPRPASLAIQLRSRFEPVVRRSRRAARRSVADAGGRRQRIAAERAGLKDFAGRQDVLHDVGAAAVGADRQAAADDFAERRQVGLDAEQSTARRRRRRGSRSSLRRRSAARRACVVSSRSAARNSGVGTTHAHVADDRFEDDAGDLVAMLRRTPAAQAGDVVVWQARACPAPCPRVTPGEFGTPSVAAELPAATSRLSTWPW